MKRVLLALMVCSLLSSNATAAIVVGIKITPGTQRELVPDSMFDVTNESVIRDYVRDTYDTTELYKSDFLNGVSGVGENAELPLENSYKTTFSPDPNPSNAIIEYLGGDYVAAPSYLVVKDGRNDPQAWYLFDLQALQGGTIDLWYGNLDDDDDLVWVTTTAEDGVFSWDGKTTLYLEGFWADPNEGAISHVALYGEVGVVPEPASLAIWAMIAVGGAAAAGARKRRGRWAKANREAILGIIEKK